MRGSVVHGLRFAAAMGILTVAVGQVQALAGPGHAPRAAGQSTGELLYQGKLLPIITDVYTSINDLSSALNNQSVTGVATAAAQFSGEDARLKAVHPIPAPLKSAEVQINNGLLNLSGGATKLVNGLKQSNNTVVQQAATQLQQGLTQFQAGVGIVRRLAGPVSLPTPNGQSNGAGPQPTPIIKGLP